jgi:hypothetical protein
MNAPSGGPNEPRPRGTRTGFAGWLAAAWKGEAAPARPPPAPVPLVSRKYLWLGLALVVVSVVILELAYRLSPVPPGVDSGDWIQRSFGWVGLAHPPVDAVGSPFLYSPLMFPFIGITVLATGSPLTTGFVFGGALLVAYGVSSVHVARRYFLSGPFQTLFVGLAVFNGTTISILFWGGYPNFLAFFFFNEALVILLLFLRTRSLRDGLLFWGVVSLLYLTHDLTFAIFAGSLGVIAILLLTQDRRWFAMMISRGNVAGLAILGATIVGYSEVTKYLKIPHPGYFGSNPPSYLIDNIGEVFRPLNSGPLFFPIGPGLVMTPLEAMAILAGAALAALLVVLVLSGVRPRWLDHRHFIAVGALIAACVVPVAGYLVHVDTDYTRFVYFLPIPLTLVLVLAVEGLLRPRLRETEFVRPYPPAVRKARRRGVSREVTALAGVLIVLVLLVVNVTIPVAVSNEKTETGTSHDAMFLQAIQWLNSNPRQGALLTTSGAVRWTEALSDRGAFDIGPTWLLFESWQIVNAEEAYWALNSLNALTNNAQVLSFTGFNTSALQQAPMYSAYIQGVQFPLLRVLPASLSANVSTGGPYVQTPAEGTFAPVVTIPGPQPNTGLITYSNPQFTVNEVGAIGPVDTSWINFTVTPSTGSQVSSFNLTLGSPAVGNSFLHAPSSTGTWWDAAGQSLAWNDSGVLGQLPGNYSIESAITPYPSPTGTPLTPQGGLNSAEMSFANPHPSQPFTISLLLTTKGDGNPAISLPFLMNGGAFLAEHDIHFLLVPTLTSFLSTEQFYESVYGYTSQFQNSEWTVLEG